MDNNHASQADDSDYNTSDGPEDSNWDNDSTMGDSIASSTCSLTPSVMEYEHQHGRRYHAFQAGRYYMPNDEKEQLLMDVVHHISLKVHDERLFLAPLESPLSILDIGTGTGTWAFDVADLFPGAVVIGTDLSPIQPSWVPSNLQFEVSDCEDEWTFSSRFDLIHMRNISNSIADWPRLLSQVHKFLKHEGWVDTPNLDIWIESNNNTLPEDSALAQWRGLLAEAVEKTGKESRSASRVAKRMVSAGFDSVTEEVFKLPLSPWVQDAKGREIAQLMQYLMIKELEGLSLALFTRVLQWSIEDLRALLKRVRADMINVEYELYCNVYYVYGQKAREALKDDI